MKRITKLLLFLSLFLVGKVNATPANTSFSDDNFYNCIITKLNTDGFNSVYDRDSTTYKVTPEELKSITVLKCNESNIENTKGLELLTELTDLNLSDNNISSINLSSNTKITNLLLSNNKLTTIDLSKNTNLENLYLTNNNLSTLNITNNLELLVLNVNQNKLTSLDITKNTKLMELKATDNAFVTQNKAVFKGNSITLTLPLKYTNEEWITTWTTKDANIASINQKGTVTALKSGNVTIIGSVNDIYSINYNIQVSEISSEIYNIDDTQGTIAVSDANIQTILNNITVTNGEAMIYNTSDKYVTSGKITTGYKLKIMQSATVLKTYTLTLVETVVNNDLKSLEVKDYTLEFDKDKTTYTIIVESDVESVLVNAIAEEETAKVKIEGNESLVEGSNTITVTVTGTDSTTKTYTINVIKKGNETEVTDNTSNVYLKKLEVKDYDLKFNSKVDYYDVKIKDDVEVLDIIAEPENEEARVEIVGNKNLKNNSRIEIRVILPDGNTKTYTINVFKNNSGTLKIIVTILALLALILATILCIVLIKKHNDKKRKKDDLEKIKNVELEVNTVSDGENIATITNTKVNDFENNEIHEEKTIKFRRICKKCGATNVLTNDNCYLCGERLEDEVE